MLTDLESLRAKLTDKEKIKSMIKLIDKVIAAIEASDHSTTIRLLRQLSWRASEVSVVTKYRDERAKSIMKENDWLALERLITPLIDPNAHPFILQNMQPIQNELQQYKIHLQLVLDTEQPIKSDIYKTLFSYTQSQIEAAQSVNTPLNAQQLTDLMLGHLSDNGFFTDASLTQSAKISTLQQALQQRAASPKFATIKKVVSQSYDDIYLHNILDYITTIEKDFDVNNADDRLCLLRVLEVIGEAAKNISAEKRSQFPSLPWNESTLENYLLTILNMTISDIVPTYTYGDNRYKILRDFIHHPGEIGSNKNKLYATIEEGSRSDIALLHQELIVLKQALVTPGVPASATEVVKLAMEIESTVEATSTPFTLDKPDIDGKMQSTPYGSVKQFYKKAINFILDPAHSKPLTDHEKQAVGLTTAQYSQLASGKLSTLQIIACLSDNPALKCNVIKRVLSTLLEKKSKVAPPNETDLTKILQESGLNAEQIALWQKHYEKLYEFYQKKDSINDEITSAIVKQSINPNYGTMIKDLQKTLGTINDNIVIQRRKVVTDEEDIIFKTYYAKFRQRLTNELRFPNLEDFFGILQFLGVSDAQLPIWRDFVEEANTLKLPKAVLAALESTLQDAEVQLQIMLETINAKLAVSPVSGKDFQTLLNEVTTELKILPITRSAFFKLAAVKKANNKITSVEFSQQKIDDVKLRLHHILYQDAVCPDSYDKFIAMVTPLISPNDYDKWQTAYESLSKKRLSDLVLHQLLLTIPLYCNQQLYQILQGNHDKSLINITDFGLILNQLGVQRYQAIKPWFTLYNNLHNIPPLSEQLTVLKHDLKKLSVIFTHHDEAAFNALSKPRLLAEFYLERIFRQLEQLAEQPEFQIAAEGLSTILRLKDLRNDLAHRFYCVDESYFLHQVYKLIMRDQVDLIEAIDQIDLSDNTLKIQNLTRFNQKLTVNPIRIEQILFENKRAFFNAFSEFGCNHSKVQIIGGMTGCRIGVQTNIDLYVPEDLTDLQAIALQQHLQQVTGHQIAVITKSKLERMVGQVIDENDKQALLESSRLFSDVLITIDHQQYYLKNPRTLFFFKGETTSRSAANFEELANVEKVDSLWVNPSEFNLMSRAALENLKFDRIFQEVFLNTVNGYSTSIWRYIHNNLRPFVDTEANQQLLIKWQQITHEILSHLRLMMTTLEQAIATRSALLVALQQVAAASNELTTEAIAAILLQYGITNDHDDFMRAIYRWFECYCQLNGFLPNNIDEMLNLECHIRELQPYAENIICNAVLSKPDEFNAHVIELYKHQLFANGEFSNRNHLLNKYDEQLQQRTQEAQTQYADWAAKSSNCLFNNFIRNLNVVLLKPLPYAGLVMKTTRISMFSIKKIDTTSYYEKKFQPHYPFKACHLIIFLKQQLELLSETQVFGTSDNNLLQKRYENICDIYSFLMTIINQIAIGLQELNTLQHQIDELECYRKKADDCEQLYQLKIDESHEKISKKKQEIHNYLHHGLITDVCNYVACAFLSQPPQRLALIEMEQVLQQQQVPVRFDSFNMVQFFVAYLKKQLIAQMQNEMMERAKFYIEYNLGADANKVFLHSPAKVTGPGEKETLIKAIKIKNPTELQEAVKTLCGLNRNSQDEVQPEGLRFGSNL